MISVNVKRCYIALHQCKRIIRRESQPQGSSICLSIMLQHQHRRNFYSKPLKGVIHWYSHKLDSHPILTKSLSSAIIAGSGDVLCQFVSNKNENFQLDYSRTLRFGVLGILLVGPVIHFWYGTLMNIFPGNSTGAVIKRVLLDQFFFSPLFLPTFLSSLWFMEGKSMDRIESCLYSTIPTSIVANWILWIPAQAINFKYVPGKYQVLFSNFAGFMWNAYLSYASHKDHNDKF
jgi:peroxisomal membrane protein 2